MQKCSKPRAEPNLFESCRGAAHFSKSITICKVREKIAICKEIFEDFFDDLKVKIWRLYGFGIIIGKLFCALGYSIFIIR